MKKKIWSVLLAMALVAALMGVSALATGKNKQYIGTDGNMTPATGTCVYITENAETYTFEKDTFYCVSGEYTLGTVTVNAGAKLIIGKEAKLTINKLIGEMTLSDEPLAIFNEWYEAGGFERTYGTCNIVDDWGVYVELYGGTYNALPESQWWSVGEQFVFRYTEESQTRYTIYFEAGSDYTVVKCDHSAGWTNGRCDACRYLCPHTNVTANKCDTCGKTMEAQIGDKVYATFEEAVEEATDGATITLLADTCVNSYTINKKLTIDLGGYTLKSDESSSKYYKSEVTVKNGTVTHMWLDGSGAKVTFNDTVKVTNMRVENGAALSGGQDLTVENLVVADATNVKLTAGAYNKITYSGDFGDLLGKHTTRGMGYAFGKNGSPSIMLPDVKNNASIEGVTIVECGADGHGIFRDGCCAYCKTPCSHSNSGGSAVNSSTGKCTDCGLQVRCAKIGNNLCNSFGEAYQSANNGDTITLLADCNCDVELAKKLTIELNGHTLKREGGDITIKNDVTINGTTSGSTIDATVAVSNGGKLTLNGGTVTALSVAEGGAAELTGGTFASLSREANGPTFAAMLKEGYAYKNGGGTFLKPAELDKEELTNVTVAECTANEANDAGKCVYCGHAFAAVVNGIGADALCEMFGTDGTIKLYKNVSENIDACDNGTLDLNGFYVDGTITVKAKSASESSGDPAIFTLMDSKESAATGYVTAITTTNGGYVKVQSGHVKTLTLYGYSEGYSDKSVLSGGKYDKIAMSNSEQYLAGLTLLPNRNYYFRYTDTKETADLSHMNTLEKVEVVKCKHETVSTDFDGTLCTVCGRQIMANIGSNHYTIFEDAYEAAKDGDTIVLVNFVELDADKVKFAKKITISYGNQNMISDNISDNISDSKQVLKITGDVTFQGEGTHSTSIEVSGTLTLTRNMQLGVADDRFFGTVSSGGKLVVNSGTIKYPLTVKDGGAAKLSGGTFEKGITVEGDVTYADLLAEGYVYADNSGDPIKLSHMASGTNVKVIAYKDHSYTNGVCDYCGRACPHSTVTGGVCTLCHGVPYRAYNPTTEKFETKACDNYTVIDENTTRVGTSGQTTWAVVKENATIDGTLAFDGAVNLILCDGATLTVSNGFRAYGNLTIYGGEKGTGKLAVTSSRQFSDDEYIAMYMNPRALTVHGGNITATVATENNVSVANSYGILTNSFTVYGGTVTGTAGAATNNSEGIHAQTMTVSGGTVTATGGTAGGNSYGIYANSGLTVSGGTVKGTGGDAGNYSYGISVTNMSVSGGTVKGTGGDAGNYSYGISVTNMSVSGGTVTVASGKKGRPKGVDASKLTVSGGTLKLTEGSSMYTKLEVSDPVTLGDLLADGCAYQLHDKDEPSKLADLTSPLSKVYIVTHDHEYEAGKCVYCGKAKPGSSGGSSGSSSYPVTPSKAENGTATADAKKAKEGDTVTVTVKPDEGYEVDSVTVLDKNGNEVAVTENADGTYSFIMPDGKVTITPTFTPLNPPSSTPDTPLEPPFDPPVPAFSDVPEGAWFAEAVAWAVGRGITTGTGGNAFSPELECSRVELVTFLWRAAGSPAPQGIAGFDDVKSEGEFYSKAVAWAVENGLVNGCGNGLFCPENPITREEVATILYRFIKLQGSGFTGAWAFRMPFDDIGEVSEWAWEAVCWCYKEGIMEGFANNLMPKEECTRAQIVTMLHRLLAE